jgi:hypothetical protein
MRHLHVSLLAAVAATAFACGASANGTTSGQNAAGIDHSSYPYALSQCSQLPASEKPICKLEAGSKDHVAWQATASEQRTLSAEQRRYQSAVAPCNRMPASERKTCKADAGLDERLSGTS